jgi:hypothetical protein
VAGTVVTLVGLGTCSILANQPGNATFQPASLVIQNFSVVASIPGGAGEGSDVPLPGWAYVMLSLGLLGIVLRRRTACPW